MQLACTAHRPPQQHARSPRREQAHIVSLVHAVRAVLQDQPDPLEVALQCCIENVHLHRQRAQGAEGGGGNAGDRASGERDATGGQNLDRAVRVRPVGCGMRVRHGPGREGGTDARREGGLPRDTKLSNQADGFQT